MTHAGESIYLRIPPLLRTAAVSTYGAWLLAWRLGPGFDRCRREAKEHDSWDAKTLADWQRRRLAQVLERAATRVPYYRDYWAGVVGAERARPWTTLENWPVLRKDAVREDPRGFLAARSTWLMQRVRTSGSSGTPLTVWRSRPTVQKWHALFEARVLDWHGLRRSEPWATFGGRLVTPITQTDPPFWAWDAPQQLLVLSSYHLAPSHARAYLEAIRDRQVTYVLGYASALHSLAKFALLDAQREEVPTLRAAISSAEPLYDDHRNTIATAFGCRVVDTYRMVETVAAASECERGHLHLWPEVGLVEVFKDACDEPAEVGEVGRLICTGLLNEDMPLIRYEVGDRGVLARDHEICPCGRALTVLRTIEGRLDDVIVLRDGRRIGRLSHVFKGNIPMREAQVVQENLDHIRVLVVPEPGYSSETAELIEARLRDRVGFDISVRVETVRSVPRGPNGKFRAVVSRVQPGPDSPV